MTSVICMKTGATDIFVFISDAGHSSSPETKINSPIVVKVVSDHLTPCRKSRARAHSVAFLYLTKIHPGVLAVLS